MTNIPFYKKDIPYLSTEQMIEVDRAMIEDYKIELIQMMENAGRNLATLARERFLDGNPKNKQIAILAGTGGNGGGAIVAARRIHNWGAKVQVFTTKPQEDFTPIPAHQLDIVERMGLSISSTDLPEDSYDLILDGVIGYSLKGNPRGRAGELITWANHQNAPILALDAPSGIDTTSGTVFEPAIKAVATMTLALPKEGLRQPNVEEQVGELYLADISVPPELYGNEQLKLIVGNIFSGNDIIRLR